MLFKILLPSRERGNKMKRFKKQFAVLTVSLVALLSLVACGSDDIESHVDRIAALEGSISALQKQTADDALRIATLEASSESQRAYIAELESQVTTLSVAAEPVSPAALSESTATEDPSDTPGYEDASYYDTVEELVAEYRSGEWDGKALRRRRGSNDITAELSITGSIWEHEGTRPIFDTVICPDLPDGKTSVDYIDHYYDDETAVYFCLDYNGIHRYQCGEEISFWPIDDVTANSEFCGLYRHGPCVIVGEQVNIPDSYGDRIIEYSDDGNLSTIVEGVLFHALDDSSIITTVSFHDGVIQYWHGTREGDRIFTVAEGATDAACVRFANYIFFTKEDGYAYVVNINAVFENEDFDATSRHQFRLGQEGVEYYAAEYQRLKDEHRNDPKDAPYYDERDRTLLLLLDEYCTSTTE